MLKLGIAGMRAGCVWKDASSQQCCATLCRFHTRPQCSYASPHPSYNTKQCSPLPQLTAEIEGSTLVLHH